MNEYLPVLEGLLFLAGDEGVDEKIIMQVIGVGDLELTGLIKEFEEMLNQPGRGLLLSKLGNKYKLITRAEHFEFYQKLVDNPTNFSFSNAALETLAIIAYNQPITRVEIENIRGVNSDSVVRKLLAKSLIRETGRKESAGRPMMYSVTEDFLDCFNLESIDQLPIIENIDLEQEEKELFSTRFSESEE